MSGELNTKCKYQVVRNDEILKDGIQLSSLKHLKQTVQKMEKGNECGVVFEAHDLEFQRGDVIECYLEKENDTDNYIVVNKYMYYL